MSFDLPNGWNIEPLSNVCTFTTGKLNANQAIHGGKYPFFTCSPEISYIDIFAFDQEAILLAGNNANGIFHIKKYSGKFNAYQRTYVINAIDSAIANNTFLYYQLGLKLNVLREISQGTATKFLTKPIIDAIKFNIPPKIEMQNIAATLSCLDDKIEMNNRINKTLEEMAQAIFKSWFVDFDSFRDCEFVESELGMIPKGWRVGTIKDFAFDMKNGGTPSRKVAAYWNLKDIAWIKTGEIKNAPIISCEEYISVEGMNNSSAKILPVNTVLMAMYGATAGKVGFLGFEAATNQACCGMICNSKNQAIFLYLCLIEKQNYIQGLAVGAAQQNLSKETISKINIIIPPLDLIEELPFSHLFSIYINNQKQIQTLAAIRDALLPKLMSGEIKIPIKEESPNA